MAREFNISQSNQTVTNASPTTFLYINPPAAPNPNLEFLRFWVGFSGAATSAQQRVQLDTSVTAFPTLTTGATPAKLKKAEPNVSVITAGTAGAAGTAGVIATAEGGAKTLHWADAFNALNGWLHVPTPAETLVMPAGFASGLSFNFPTAPVVLTSWAFGLVFREV